MTNIKRNIILVVLLIFSIILIGGGIVYSKYITKISGNASIDVAQPIINIIGINDSSLTISNTTCGLVYGFKVSNYTNNNINQIKQDYKIIISSTNSDIFSVIDYALFKTPTLEDLNACLEEFKGYDGTNKTISSQIDYTEVELNNNKTGINELKIDEKQNDYYFVWIKNVTSKEYLVNGKLNINIETVQKSN